MKWTIETRSHHLREPGGELPDQVVQLTREDGEVVYIYPLHNGGVQVVAKVGLLSEPFLMSLNDGNESVILEGQGERRVGPYLQGEREPKP